MRRQTFLIVFLSMVAVGGGSQFFLKASAGTRVLSDAEMSTSVYGANPVCDTTGTYTDPCADRGNVCAGRTRAECTSRCYGCSEAATIQTLCLVDSTKTPDKFCNRRFVEQGCGVQVQDKICAWDEGLCKCQGGTKLRAGCIKFEHEPQEPCTRP
jgi:hypothetical protein